MPAGDGYRDQKGERGDRCRSGKAGSRARQGRFAPSRPEFARQHAPTGNPGHDSSTGGEASSRNRPAASPEKGRSPSRNQCRNREHTALVDHATSRGKSTREGRLIPTRTTILRR